MNAKNAQKRKQRPILLDDTEYEVLRAASGGNFNGWARAVLLHAAQGTPIPSGTLIGGPCGLCQSPGAWIWATIGKMFVCETCSTKWAPATLKHMSPYGKPIRETLIDRLLLASREFAKFEDTRLEMSDDAPPLPYDE